MDTILISIHPKWCELIVNGKKTIEVRKRKPRNTPCRVLIYCTNAGKICKVSEIFACKDQFFLNPDTKKYEFGYPDDMWRWSEVYGDDEYSKDNFLSGKVIGEFVCDKVEEYSFSNLEAEYRITDIDIMGACLNHPELINYGKGKPLYGWHISGLKIYDNPKELSEFNKRCILNDNRRFCKFCSRYPCDRKITRPPQSFMYVDEI